jgi:hypothetical protein
LSAPIRFSASASMTSGRSVASAQHQLGPQRVEARRIRVEKAEIDASRAKLESGAAG